MYGLDDASRKFWLKVKETLTKLGLKTIPGDEAFYYENKNGKLLGAVLSHVDDFIVAGKDEFVDRIVKGVSSEFTVSKTEKDEFRFTGLDVKTKGKEIEVSMEENARLVELIEEIRRADKEEKLTQVELKEYRKYTGKMSCLSQGS